MKKITEIRSVFSAKNVLTAQEMAKLRGGNIIAKINSTVNSIVNTANNTANPVVTDDKRRERPGGGISTL